MDDSTTMDAEAALSETGLSDSPINAPIDNASGESGSANGSVDTDADGHEPTSSAEIGTEKGAEMPTHCSFMRKSRNSAVADSNKRRTPRRRRSYSWASRRR